MSSNYRRLEKSRDNLRDLLNAKSYTLKLARNTIYRRDKTIGNLKRLLGIEVIRYSVIRGENKELERIRKEADHQAEELRRLKERTYEIEKENLKKMQESEEKIRRLIEERDKLLKESKSCGPLQPILKNDEDERALAVQLAVKGLSFRSIPKVMAIFKPFRTDNPWLMHFTSTINWSLRYGVDLISKVQPIKENWTCIVDATMTSGDNRVLAFLRVKQSALKKRKSAITMEDGEIIGLEVVNICDGEAVKRCMEKVFKKAGDPSSILKDGGSDLERGTNLYCQERPEKKIYVLEDLGHKIANGLKREFSKEIAYKGLLRIASEGSKKLRQTKAAAYVAPKMRTKGRFQSIGRVTKWSSKISLLMAQRGRVKADSEVAILRKAFRELPQLKKFIARFDKTCLLTNKIQKILKNKGLSEKTAAKCRKILLKLPETSVTRQVTEDWLERHLEIQKVLMPQGGLLVSTDILESIFGRFKELLRRSSTKEMNRLVYLIPTYCGFSNIERIKEAFRETSHTDMQAEIARTIPRSLRQIKIEKMGSGRKRWVPNLASLKKPA
jgi:hypothetical protein